MMRDALTITLLRPTALARSSAPTISKTNACRAGLSMAITQPCSRARTNTIQTVTTSVETSTPSASASTAATHLHRQQQATFVDAVGDHAAPRPEHEDRARTGAPSARRACSALPVSSQHQPALCDRLHPGAAHRDHLGEEVDAEVVQPQRAEGAHGELSRHGRASSSGYSRARSPATRGTRASRPPARRSPRPFSRRRRAPGRRASGCGPGRCCRCGRRSKASRRRAARARRCAPTPSLSTTSRSMHSTTAVLPRRLAVTAACDVAPPRAVRMALTRVIMAMSSGTVSGRSSTMLSSGASARGRRSARR